AARLEQRGQKADRRALPGPVRPDEAEHLPRADLEVQRLDRAKVAVVFTEIDQLNHVEGLGLVAAAGGCVFVSLSIPSGGASGSACVSRTVGSMKSSARFLSGLTFGSGPRARWASTSV